jgi:GcrA cell cycle regulator
VAEGGMSQGWTEERVGALKKLWLEGQSASQIAKALGGVTRNAVIGKVHRLGLSGRAAPSQPVRTTFRAPRPRPQPTARPSAPRRIEAAQPRVAAPVQPTPVVAPDLPGTATVQTLGAHMCKWPIGDPGSDGFSFCGRRATQGVYCAEHARVAYQPQARKGARLS